MVTIVLPHLKAKREIVQSLHWRSSEGTTPLSPRELHDAADCQ